MVGVPLTIVGVHVLRARDRPSYSIRHSNCGFFDHVKSGVSKKKETPALSPMNAEDSGFESSPVFDAVGLHHHYSTISVLYT